MATTLYRLAEECMKIINGGQIQSATNVSFNECKIAICQVANNLLKVEHFTINEKMGEKIPNGSVLGLYEGITFSKWVNGRSRSTLPIKPIKLPRNMGVFSVFPPSQPDKEFIPLQMGQSSLIKSQSLLNNLLGQIGYEVFGLDVVYTKDLTQAITDTTVSMRLAILDFSEYDDYDPLPILPEQEWQIKKEVIQLYSNIPISDYLVDPSVKQQQNVPIKDQQQT